MFETVTYRVEKLQKLKQLEDGYFACIFAVLSAYKAVQRILPWADPFREKL